MTGKAPKKTARLTALLGLAATHPGSTDACPSDEQLAAFIAHGLKAQARQRMLAHLNHCPQCYHHWLEAAAYLDTAHAKPAAEHKISPLPTLWQRSITWLTPWKLAVPAAAVAAMVFAMLLWPNSLDLEERINADYSAIAGHSAASRSALQNLPMPWENLALGFNTAGDSLPKKAFGAGLWAGRTVLLGMDTMKSPLPEFLSSPSGPAWSETEWADYYQLGRWVMLLWALTQADKPAQDWSQQHDILEKLRASLAKRPSSELEAGQALNSLERLQGLLAQVQGQADPAVRARLSRRLEMIMQQLAPIKG